jgi:hypothetical protein|nr:MAG: hypothetical protein [Lake Baikal virophage 4]
MPKIIIKKKSTTERDKAVVAYHINKKEKLRFENRQPDYHELQEQLCKMTKKAQTWKDRFHTARQDYGKNCDFEEEVQIFGLGCKICGEWCYGEIDMVDEFRIDGERWEGNDKIPVCNECAEKCKARDDDYEEVEDARSSSSSSSDDSDDDYEEVCECGVPESEECRPDCPYQERIKK